MAQYEKLINLSLLNQFLTKAKTIFAPKITASGILKGDGNGGVSAATAGTDYATPAQSLALGLTGASVGDLVRVNAVDETGKPTSWKKVALNEIKCNKNLLDNWYFVGGGSQLGDGVFPINQRGQTSYIGGGYGVDRWNSYQGFVNIAITSDGINITRSSGDYHSLIQKINKPESLRGKKVTASMLATGYRRIRIVANNVGIADSGETSTNELVSATAVIPNDTTELFVSIYTSTNITTVVKAVKLELGSEQTLAHNEGTEENPVWVLNEIPDYETELLRCISSHADTSDNFANKDYASALKVGPRIESGGDLDNYRYTYQAGTYAIASGVANSPEAWSIVLVIPSPSGGCRQIAFGGAKIYLRAYSGSPLAWSAWKSITLS